MRRRIASPGPRRGGRRAHARRPGRGGDHPGRRARSAHGARVDRDRRRGNARGRHARLRPRRRPRRDNASGVALLLELAERLPAAPRGATVRLGFWAAEELGLYGSKVDVRSLPKAERKRFTAYLNFDMVGSPRAVTKVYREDARLRRVLRRALPNAGLTSPGDASDHAPFRTAGIPVGGVYSGGPERARGGGRRDACYHRACDDLDNVSLSTLARTATAAERTMVSLVRAG